MHRALVALTASMAITVPAAASASTTTTVATYRDLHDDVTRYKGSVSTGKVSHPFDVYAVTGRTTTASLVVATTFDDLTATNTRQYTKPDGWTTMNGQIQAEVYVNGTYRYVINRGFEDQWSSGAELRRTVAGPYGPEPGGDPVDCSPGDDSLHTGVTQRIDLEQDRLVYRVPLSCVRIRPGDRVRVNVQASLHIDGARYSYHDAAGKTPVFTLQ